jgi:hypothetical protein
MRALTTLPVAASLLLAACGGGGDGGTEPAPCTDAAVTLSHTTTTSYGCGDAYRTKILIQNGGCASLAITKLDIGAQVTSCSVATCVASCASPPGASTGTCSYPLDVFVAPKATGTVLDLTGDGYHYSPGGLSMVERYTYTVTYLQGGSEHTVSADPVDVTVTLPQPCP